jgi:hypothetical protein
MKLFDFNPHSETHHYFSTIESFSGTMVELSHEDITKSFPKAKKEALKRLNRAKKNLEEAIREVELMNESDVYNREIF